MVQAGVSELRVVSLWSSKDSSKDSFRGTGILLDSHHVLTAAHVVDGLEPVYVGLIDGRHGLSSAHKAARHDRFDAAIVRLEVPANYEVVPPRLLEAFRRPVGALVSLHVVSPDNFEPQAPGNFSVGNYDEARGEFQLLPENARGHSGGAVVDDGVVIGMLVQRRLNDPICFAVSLHKLLPWIREHVHVGQATATARARTAVPSSPQASQRGRPGFSRQLGAIHLHVDGAHARDFVEGLVRRHTNSSYPAEYSRVLAFAGGPQRRLKPRAYGVHTPGEDDHEELDFFSTTLLHEGPNSPSVEQIGAAWQITHETLVELHAREFRGVVVELERTVATVDEHGKVEIDRLLQMPAPARARLLGSTFVPFGGIDVDRPDGADYEYHFSLDIARCDGQAPIGLDYLLDVCVRCGIDVGGWFLFEDSERWAYRSNSFEDACDEEDLRQRWKRLREELAHDPSPLLRQARLRLLVEESVGVWRTPFKKHLDSYLTVPELARWEGSRTNLEEFWVVAPNFLGDQDKRVEKAMVTNLNAGVRYVYFLRSDADAKRWLAFKSRLEGLVGEFASRLSAYVVEFQQVSDWDNHFAFIANPRGDREGVSLHVDPTMRQAYRGVRMSANTVAKIVDVLRPALDGGAIEGWHSVRSAGPSEDRVTLCAHLQVVPDENLLDRLDSAIATEASRAEGEVVLYGGKSIIATFRGGREGITRALRCAMRLMERAEALGAAALGLRLGLDFGEVRRVPRSCGMIWAGLAIRGCRQILDLAPERVGVYLSADASELLRRAGTAPDIEIREAANGLVEVVAAAARSELPHTPVRP